MARSGIVAYTSNAQRRDYKRIFHSKFMKPRTFALGNWPVLLPLFFVLAIAILFPIAVLVRESLQSNGQFSLATYRRFFDFTSAANLRALFGSINISLLTVAFSALFGVPLAVFSRASIFRPASF
jgi:ABC-type spermidine/putrescine transport system permease subunit I